jgi:hypothetical protein
MGLDGVALTRGAWCSASLLLVAFRSDRKPGGGADLMAKSAYAFCAYLVDSAD